MSILNTNNSYATNPGNFKVSIKKFLKYNEIVGLKYYYYSYILRSSLDELFDKYRKKDILVLKWVLINKRLLKGAINPCIILNSDLGLIASYSDLDIGIGVPVHAIKIFKENPDFLNQYNLSTGDKTVSVSTYTQNEDLNTHSWSDFAPSLPVFFISELSDYERAKKSISIEEWKNLAKGLELIGPNFQEGLFHFEVQSESMNQTMNEQVSSQLNIKGQIKYAVHKIGFHYTDECFVAENNAGSIIRITNSIEEAKKIKKQSDIDSIIRYAGMNSIDLFFYNPKFEEIYDNLKIYYKSNNIDFDEDDEGYLELPSEMTEEQAIDFLKIMEITFHNVIEYSDEINIEYFNNISKESELDEF